MAIRMNGLAKSRYDTHFYCTTCGDWFEHGKEHRDKNNSKLCPICHCRIREKRRTKVWDLPGVTSL